MDKNFHPRYCLSEDDKFHIVTNEEQFQERIAFLKGKYKLEEIASRCKSSIYFTLEVECEVNGFAYSATILGEIFDFYKVEEARENVFKKGCQVLEWKYYNEIKNWMDARFEAIKNGTFNKNDEYPIVSEKFPKQKKKAEKRNLNL